MASWLSLSLFDEQNDDEQEDDANPNPSSQSVNDTNISAVITRQFRGVAAFLAPPPSSAEIAAVSPPDSPLLGIKNDLVEIGGSFKSKLSLISSNKAVTEISRFANSLLQFGDDADERLLGQGLGLSDEVVTFVQDISERPQLWTEFPLSLETDFEMSDIQREHTAAIEEMVPSMTSLRHEICKTINEDSFWMIYFVLLLPRLNEYDAKLLSTPECCLGGNMASQWEDTLRSLLHHICECKIVEAREILLHRLQKINMAPPVNSEVSESAKTLKNSGGNDNSTEANNRPTHRNAEISYALNSKEFEEKDVGTYSCDEVKQSEEDSPFSDLESDDNYLSGKQPGYRQSGIPSCSESGDWVELNESFGLLGDKQKTVPSTSRENGSESEESNEWLTIDDSDLDRPAVG